jgi:hypothetical protein
MIFFTFFTMEFKKILIYHLNIISAKGLIGTPFFWTDFKNYYFHTGPPFREIGAMAQQTEHTSRSMNEIFFSVNRWYTFFHTGTNYILVSSVSSLSFGTTNVAPHVPFWIKSPSFITKGKNAVSRMSSVSWICNYDLLHAA